MRTGRRGAVGSIVAGAAVLVGAAVLWRAPGGEGPPQAVAEVLVVGAEDAPDPEGPRVVEVEPGDGILTTVPGRAGRDADTPAGEPVDPSGLTVGGYAGWWSGDGHGEACDAYADAHPAVVLVSTRTGAVLEAHTNGTRLQHPPQTPPGDPAEWPKDSVVVLEAGTGDVLESFEVDESGWPTDPPYVHCVPPSETP